MAVGSAHINVTDGRFPRSPHLAMACTAHQKSFYDKFNLRVLSRSFLAAATIYLLANARRVARFAGGGKLHGVVCKQLIYDDASFILP